MTRVPSLVTVGATRTGALPSCFHSSVPSSAYAKVFPPLSEKNNRSVLTAAGASTGASAGNSRMTAPSRRDNAYSAFPAAEPTTTHSPNRTGVLHSEWLAAFNRGPGRRVR